MTKVFLSTPCYGGLCLEKYMSSMIKLQLLLIKEGIQMYLDTTENESLVHRARNVSVGRFMQKTDCDYFMFIDADVHFDPEAPIKDGFIEILDGPTGFMMIKRSVFKTLEEKFPELWCKNDHQNRDFDDYHACFDCMIDPVTRRYLSEDYAFCRRWQQVDGKIYADVNTTLGHVGNLPFGGCLNDRLKV